MAGKSTTIIDMKPNSDGVFEAGKVSKVKLDKLVKEDVRPDADKPRPPKKAKSKSHGKGRRRPIESIVPRPVSEFAEGIQAGLEVLGGINSILKVFR